MPKITIESRIDKLRKEYEQAYDLSSLNSANDKAALEMILRSTIIVQDLQDQQLGLMEIGLLENAADFKKINDMIKSTTDTIMSLERALGIDRKSRRSEDNSESPAEYIKALKIRAREFLEQRIQKVMCADCRIQLFRFLPTYEHNKFEIKLTCPQCQKVTRVHREEKSILIDVPNNDRKWREKYPYTVVQPINHTEDVLDNEDDELLLDG